MQERLLLSESTENLTPFKNKVKKTADYMKKAADSFQHPENTIYIKSLCGKISDLTKSYFSQKIKIENYFLNLFLFIQKMQENDNLKNYLHSIFSNEWGDVVIYSKSTKNEVISYFLEIPYFSSLIENIKPWSSAIAVFTIAIMKVNLKNKYIAKLSAAIHEANLHYTYCETYIFTRLEQLFIFVQSLNNADPQKTLMNKLFFKLYNDVFFPTKILREKQEVDNQEIKIVSDFLQLQVSTAILNPFLFVEQIALAKLEYHSARNILIDLFLTDKTDGVYTKQALNDHIKKNMSKNKNLMLEIFRLNKNSSSFFQNKTGGFAKVKNNIYQRIPSKYYLDKNIHLHLGKGSHGKAKLLNNLHKSELKVIKVFKFADMPKEKMQEKYQELQKEAAILTQAGHFTTLLKKGQEENKHYLFMDYIPGVTLDEYLKVTSNKNSDELLNIAEKIAAELENLHAVNILHLDLKPENIMYCPKSRKLSLIDFGFAEDIAGKDEISMKTIKGTGDFMEPSLLQSVAVYRKQTDLFALGVTYGNIFGIEGTTRSVCRKKKTKKYYIGETPLNYMHYYIPSDILTNLCKILMSYLVISLTNSKIPLLGNIKHVPYLNMTAKKVRLQVSCIAALNAYLTNENQRNEVNLKIALNAYQDADFIRNIRAISMHPTINISAEIIRKIEGILAEIQTQQKSERKLFTIQEDQPDKIEDAAEELSSTTTMRPGRGI